MEEHTIYTSKPSGRVVFSWIFTKLLAYLVLYVFIFGFVFIRASKTGFDVFGGTGSSILLIIFALIMIIFVYLVFLWTTYSYKITDKGIYFKGGIIIRKQKFVPFFKITNIETTQNIIEQILGIYRIGFQTAGTGGLVPEIVFEGLEDVEKPKQVAYQFIEKTRKTARYDE